MKDFNFQPFDKVLVRDNDQQNWCCDFFSHVDVGGDKICTGTWYYEQMIPYNEDTKHLLGTTKAYEPPKPPHEYKWGDKIEAFYKSNWQEAIFNKDDGGLRYPIRVSMRSGGEVCWVNRDQIRPVSSGQEN